MKTYTIAEMACAHEGKLQLAKRIVDGAGEAKVDAIQFQIWSLKHMMTTDRLEYKILKSLEFSKEEWKDLYLYSKNKYPEIDIFVFLYEHKSIAFTEELGVSGYKLSSSDLSNPYMLDCVAQTRKQINLSIGASTISEIQYAVERIRKVSSSKINLMYGIQSFPTLLQDIHLSYMKKLSKLFELPVGYQDHCDAETPFAFWVPALAQGMGANIIEKHITHNRAYRGIDHESALNPNEFDEFVKMIRELDISKGISIPKPFTSAELNYRKFQKKSIVAVRSILSGKVIKKEDLNILRATKLGLSPNEIDNLIGKIAKRNILKNDILTTEDLF